MDELIKQVSQKAGLSDDQAAKAVETVLSFIKEKLPTPIASQVDSVLGGADVTKNASEMLKGVGGLLGR